jgi:HAD superfamily hydrolase (TIGR01509 family)
MKHWLLIDFDNTLMATEKHALPSLIARFNQLYATAIGRDLTLDEFHRECHGQSRQSLCKNLGRYFSIEVDHSLLFEDREWKMMQHLQQLPHGIEMADGAFEALSTLYSQDHRFAIVTNNSIQRAFAALRVANNGKGRSLAQLFEANFFEAGDVQKPDPTIYLRAMEQLKTNANNCFAVEDSVSGATAAVRAGLRTFAFTGFAENPEESAKKLRAVGCMADFQTWKDFPALLAKFI